MAVPYLHRTLVGTYSQCFLMAHLPLVGKGAKGQVTSWSKGTVEHLEGWRKRWAQSTVGNNGSFSYLITELF